MRELYKYPFFGVITHYVLSLVEASDLPGFGGGNEKPLLAKDFFDRIATPRSR